jgi:hypothetical protein
VILGVFEPLQWFIVPFQRRKGAKLRNSSFGSDRSVQAVLTGVKCIASKYYKQPKARLCQRCFRFAGIAVYLLRRKHPCAG